MKRFTQYLRESEFLTPATKRLLLSTRDWADFSYNYDVAVGFFTSAWVAAHDALPKNAAANIREVRRLMGLGSLPGRTMYRIFPQDTLMNALEGDVKAEFDKIKWGPQSPKLALLNAALDGKMVPLNTGVSDIQNWTEDRAFPAKFHSTYTHEKYPYFVTVESSFTSNEILWGWPDFEKLNTVWGSWLEYLHNYYPAEPAIDTQSIDGRIRAINTYMSEAVIFAGKTKAESEFIVDIHQPRPVKVLSIIGY